MPVLVPETAVVGRILVAAEFGPHGVIDQLGQITRDFDIGALIAATTRSLIPRG